jgi:hypothetical protein
MMLYMLQSPKTYSEFRVETLCVHIQVIELAVHMPCDKILHVTSFYRSIYNF